VRVLERLAGRHAAVASALVGLGLLLAWGWGSGFRASRVSQFLIFGIVYLSLVVLSGMSGVVSLLSATFLGFGAFTAATVLVRTDLPFALAVPAAALVTAAVCILVGLPVLRLRTSAFLVMTLGFAALVDEVVFTNEWCCGGGTRGVPAPRPALATSDQAYMVLCAVVAVALFAFTAAWRRGRIGRALIASRENPSAAEVLGVNVTKARLVAFAVSGGLAGLAGGLFAGLLQSVSSQGGTYGIDRGIEFFGFAMLGGITSLAGPVIAATLRVLVQVVVDGSRFSEHTGLVLLGMAGPGIVLVQLRAPDGIAGIVRRILRRAPTERTEHQVQASATSPARPGRAPAWEGWPGGAHLRCEGITCTFGGVRALDDVSVTVHSGEVVGLLGTNGAGKSTLINVISGLAPAASGRVTLQDPDGPVDVLDLLPYQRASAGIGRTFQDVRLFPSMTCVENLLLATHVRQRRGLLANGLLLPPARREERTARAQVDAVLELVDLRPFAEAAPAELSYGTLRMLELAAMLVLRPRLLLLDEPASGVAEAEARTLGPLLRRIRDETGVSMMLVEHDVALVAAVSDRIVGMDAGRVLIDGPPEVVLADEAMITAYLGAEPGDDLAGSSQQVVVP
jgi:branched-chain amino acid transport system permease protein